MKLTAETESPADEPCPNGKCATCGGDAFHDRLYGYKEKGNGSLVWYCAKHKPHQSYADAQWSEPAEIEPIERDTALAEHADAIRKFMKRAIEDVFSIGRHLTEAKKLCDHGNWLSWLDREFGWSADTAERLMQLHALGSQNPRVRNLDLPRSALYLLAKPSTPEAARQEVFDKTESGEPVSVEQTRQTIKRHKPDPEPPPVTVPQARAGKPPVNWDQIKSALAIIRAMDVHTRHQFEDSYKKLPIGF